MKIFVKAKPFSKEEYVEKIDDENYVVAVSAPPVKGQANLAIVKALAEHFRVAQSQIKILSGHFSRNKVIEILE